MTSVCGDADADDRPPIDWGRAAYLCAHGAPDLIAAVCVDADGQDELWLISRAQLDSAHPIAGCRDQSHERTGRLPRHVRERIFGEMRCGFLRANGRPCRHLVKEPGQHCPTHTTTGAP